MNGANLFFQASYIKISYQKISTEYKIAFYVENRDLMLIAASSGKTALGLLDTKHLTHQAMGNRI